MDERLQKAENIIFDIGNVLLRFYPERVFEQMPESMRNDLYRAMFEPVNGRTKWSEFDLGQRPNEEIARDVAIASGHAEATEAILQALAYFPDTMQVLPLAGEMEGLKKMGKRLYALTNYPEPSLTITMKKFPFFSLLDGYVVSSREKMMKPDEAIFRLILEKYALNPEKTLFIDDSAQNVQAARNVGLNTWHYTGWKDYK